MARKTAAKQARRLARMQHRRATVMLLIFMTLVVMGKRLRECGKFDHAVGCSRLVRSIGQFTMQPVGYWLAQTLRAYPFCLLTRTILAHPNMFVFDTEPVHSFHQAFSASRYRTQYAELSELIQHPRVGRWMDDFVPTGGVRAASPAVTSVLYAAAVIDMLDGKCNRAHRAMVRGSGP